MKWKMAGSLLIIFAVGMGFWGWKILFPPYQADPTDKLQVAQGQVVYQRHCAACHGENLEGQPDWRSRKPSGRLPAPPHDETGHTWHHPDKLLVEITKYGPGKLVPGGYESDMPAFEGTLPDKDIWAAVAYIKSTWPFEVLARQAKSNQ